MFFTREPHHSDLSLFLVFAGSIETKQMNKVVYNIIIHHESQ